MSATLQKQLELVNQKLQEVKSSTSESRKQFADKIEHITKFSSRYEKSWDGDWYRSDYNVYQYKFDSTSDEHSTEDEKSIKEDLKQQSGIDLDELRDQITPIAKVFIELKDFILAELSFIKGNDLFSHEEELLNQIEKFKWGIQGEFIRMKRPTQVYTYDPSIINNAKQVPPHIAVSDEVIFSFSLLQAYDAFEKLTHRLIRQLELKTSSESEGKSNLDFQLQVLQAIIEKFHLVATQLQSRHAGRTTLKIEDEYDVQDLIHALLKINFEDVRKEEYTPSYAGGSARTDFLLKREKIFIEVKKTRPTLKSREVGDQLILDIIRYKAHQDCRHLICFVYDPEHFIENPRGLEDDLNKNSSEELLVEVFIRP